MTTVYDTSTVYDKTTRWLKVDHPAQDMVACRLRVQLLRMVTTSGQFIITVDTLSSTGVEDKLACQAVVYADTMAATLRQGMPVSTHLKGTLSATMALVGDSKVNNYLRRMTTFALTLLDLEGVDE